MTSIVASTRQVDAQNNGFYMPVSSLVSSLLTYNSTAGTFAAATWAQTGVTSSFINAAGRGILRDLGKTVTSSLRTFRKVQLVAPPSLTANSTFGVAGAAPNGTPGDAGYLSAYIELGFEGTGTPAPVAKFGK